jgi:NAD(P)-dependent dehydrogenase (short-subunit alcohol dehydrogenase family)
MATNVCGTMLMCKHVLPTMMSNGRGSIINISSAHGLSGHDTFPAYASSKAAVVALTRHVATAYGPRGVRCNAIAPGAIGTPRSRATLPEERQKQIAATCVIPRLGETADIANAVAFLASDRSSYISGQTLSVDGGLLMHLPATPGTR